MANAFRRGVVSKKAASLSTPLPMPKIDLFKLDLIGEVMDGLDGRKTSELSTKEKMVVEMFFRRAMCNKEGKIIKIEDYDNCEDPYRVLVLHSWTMSFLVSAYDMPISPLPIKVYEDEPIDFLGLQCGSFKSTNSPLVDAVHSWPDNYLPIRLSKGKRCATFYSKSTTNYKPGDRKYAERDNFFGTREVKPSIPPLLPKESSMTSILKKGWHTFCDDLKHDVVLGLQFPERFEQHFKTKLNLKTIEIPAEEKEDITYFIKVGEGFRFAPIE